MKHKQLNQERLLSVMAVSAAVVMAVAVALFVLIVIESLGT